MTNNYDRTTAFHYSIYRPSLHFIILKECLKHENICSLGLDVGCGTGQSSIALTRFCNNVVGIEPSKAMLHKAIYHPRIEYKYYNKENFTFPNDYFDVITFAGSLFYAKSQALLNEVVRVSKNSSRIVIYDFELSLDWILEKLNLKRSHHQNSSYDHQIDFNELYDKPIKIKGRFTNNIPLEISLKNLSHLLLSSREHYYLLLKTFGQDNLYNELLEKLYSTFTTETIVINATTYSTVYQNIKERI